MAIDASPERGASYFLVTDLKQGDLRFERTVVEIFAITLCRESLILVSGLRNVQAAAATG